MSKTGKGVILLAVGIIGLIVVYSFRPPSGFGELLIRAGSGRDFFLHEPVYLTFMAIATLTSLVGGIFLFQGLKKEGD